MNILTSQQLELVRKEVGLAVGLAVSQAVLKLEERMDKSTVPGRIKSFEDKVEALEKTVKVLEDKVKELEKRLKKDCLGGIKSLENKVDIVVAIPNETNVANIWANLAKDTNAMAELNNLVAKEADQKKRKDVTKVLEAMEMTEALEECIMYQLKGEKGLVLCHSEIRKQKYLF